MTAATAALVQPVTLVGLPLTSQFVMAPMTRERSPGGIPTAQNAAYYRRRAEHGIGLIITEGVLVDHPSAGHQTDVPRLTEGAAEAGWKQVTSEVHAAGGRIAAQLWHLGSRREPVDGYASWTPATMTGRDFDTLLSAYAESARVAVRAGFDAVEVHAAHGYLLDEFLWPVTNPTLAHRDFPAEVVRAIRAEIPSCMPLIVRFSQFKERDYSARIAETPAELATVLEGLRAAGADVLHASQRRFWEPIFDGSHLNLAGWAKHLTGLPSITVGSIGLTRDFASSARMAELLDRRARGEYDLIGLGRVLLGNPAWVTLAAAGRHADMNDYYKTDEERYF
ncbi:12-oxophytodienoate reductase [Paractinoplanes abujensis]|uniref:2,4-dienoyl-CoA reductase-like NADH-dependent reductase (Old Yellow Enzyme family) n=1 Tax=Paractinoplanes abujensis TaxID=882441 RepID=A0A7W7G1J8_9ACTN|nr:12-oxophytodienoate reductase [Actinoplanes abujensis]MBB4690701.1 2,4-dienoyl-CoA reductase-like NADH-dependent reductase (Old Yellow Enzyme family) [Actinoplanes abujensis]GID17886.1 12-oxophytodienoate reductase [Actinoplanes abujensis]